MKNGKRWASSVGASLGSALKLSDWGMRQTWWVEPSGVTSGEPTRHRVYGRRGSRRRVSAEGPSRRAA